MRAVHCILVFMLAVAFVVVAGWYEHKGYERGFGEGQGTERDKVAKHQCAPCPRECCVPDDGYEGPEADGA